jgi:DNA-binding MarR family transcriptional regulator
MSIENDIMQKKFRSPLHKAYLNILFTGNWMLNKELEMFKAYGLSSQQYNVLRILKGQYPNAVKVGCIAERMLDRNSNTSRLIDKLYAKGYVHRVVCPKDRRAMDVTLTSEGMDILEQLEPILIELETETAKNITEEEATILSELLDKLRNSK